MKSLRFKTACKYALYVLRGFWPWPWLWLRPRSASVHLCRASTVLNGRMFISIALQRRLFKSLLFLIFLAPAWCFAWSKQGHEYIAQAAYEVLPKQNQKYFESVFSQAKRSKSFSGMSPEKQIAYLGHWPDKVRDKTLGELFRQYGTGVVPPSLKTLAVNDTKKWHYANERFWSLDQQRITQCRTKNNGQLLMVWPKLIDAFAQTSDHSDRLIVLSFIIHMAADAYQPLHTAAAVNKSCLHDRGGNQYCIKPPIGFSGGSKRAYQNKCEENLHQIWDGGFGAFSTDGPAISDKSARAVDIDIHSLSHTLALNEQYLSHIYIKPNLAASADYTKKSRLIVEKQRDEAIHFLSVVLKALSTKAKTGE